MAKIALLFVKVLITLLLVRMYLVPVILVIFALNLVLLNVLVAVAFSTVRNFLQCPVIVTIVIAGLHKTAQQRKPVMIRGAEAREFGAVTGK